MTQRIIEVVRRGRAGRDTTPAFVTQVIATTQPLSAEAGGSLFLVDASAGDVTITLPAVAQMTSAAPILLQRTDVNSAAAVNIDGNGAELILGANSRPLRVHESIELRTDGVSWFVTSLSFSQFAAETLAIPMSAFWPKATGGAAGVSVDWGNNVIGGGPITSYDFDAGTEEAIQTIVRIPNRWDFGHVYGRCQWSEAATAGAGSVVWAMRAQVITDQDSFLSPFVAESAVTSPFGAAGTLKDAGFTNFPADGTPDNNSQLVVELARKAADGADTYTQDARMRGFSLNFFINTVTDV